MEGVRVVVVDDDGVRERMCQMTEVVFHRPPDGKAERNVGRTAHINRLHPVGRQSENNDNRV